MSKMPPSFWEDPDAFEPGEVVEAERKADALDEALICHVAWVGDDGRVRALPTIQARVADTLYLHGSRAARAWKAVAEGAEVCVVATIVDGLVLARSAFNHSMNYRSVVLFGA